MVATDLDGTLLDDTYPTRAAALAVDEIQRQQIGLQVVLASSKTLVEMMAIVEHTRRAPFLIFENGGGVAWPRNALMRPGQFAAENYEVTLLGEPYAEVCKALDHLRDDGFRFRGFSHMSQAEVAQLTGLSPAAAALARKRLTGEAIQWQDSTQKLDVFLNRVREAGLTAQQGGRFLHVSFGANKMTALEFLRVQIRYETGTRSRILACGDAPNDLEMIDKADHALLFPDSEGNYLRQTHNTVAHATVAGPQHWLEGVQKIVATHE